MSNYTLTITEAERATIQTSLYKWSLANASPGTSEHDQVFDLYSKIKNLATRMSIVEKDTVDYYIAWTNTDRTEGRGSNVPEAISLSEATAIRLGKGRSVQGSDCRITKDTAIRIFGKMYCPLTWASAKIVAPSKEDVIAEQKLAEKRAREEKRQQVLEHARSLGLSDDDIALLSSKE